MISHPSEKIKSWLALFRPHALPAVFLFLGVLGVFGLFRLMLIFPQKTAIQIEKSGAITSPGHRQFRNELPYVASVNGGVYYRTSCTGAERIGDENRIFFATAQEAEETGYTPAKNCPPNTDAR